MISHRNQRKTPEMKEAAREFRMLAKARKARKRAPVTGGLSGNAHDRRKAKRAKTSRRYEMCPECFGTYAHYADCSRMESDPKPLAIYQLRRGGEGKR